MLKIESAFNYVTKDLKETLIFCLILFLIGFIPIVGQIFILGITVKIISNIIEGNYKVPKMFDNIGEDFMIGLKYFIFSLILFIPIILIFLIFNGSVLIETLLLQQGNLPNITSLGMMLIFLALLSIIYLLIVPALLVNFAKKKTFSSFFEFKKAYKMVFENFSSFLKMIGIMILYSVVISIINSILSWTVIIPFLFIGVSLLANSNILGEWYKEVYK